MESSVGWLKRCWPRSASSGNHTAGSRSRRSLRRCRIAHALLPVSATVSCAASLLRDCRRCHRPATRRRERRRSARQGAGVRSGARQLHDLPSRARRRSARPRQRRAAAGGCRRAVDRKGSSGCGSSMARRSIRTTIMPPYHRIDGLNRVGREWAGKPVLSAQEVEDIVAFLATLRSEATGSRQQAAWTDWHARCEREVGRVSRRTVVAGAGAVLVCGVQVRARRSRRDARGDARSARRGARSRGPRQARYSRRSWRTAIRCR